MHRRLLGCVSVLGFAAACGSSVDIGPPGKGAGGATGSGVVSSSGSSSGGGGGSPTGGGGAGSGGDGAGGSAGGLPASTCAVPDYCTCISNAACKVVVEDCYCPCGVEPCAPDCDCDCGGGKYLGCAPTTIYNPGALEGIWLIGWSGGAHHFSWLRIEADFKLTVNDGAGLFANLPFYECNGAGEWNLAAKPETVFLLLPAPCAAGPLTFTAWTGETSWPKGCLQSAIVESDTLGMSITACRFPLDQCDATMSTCIDPLAP